MLSFQSVFGPMSWSRERPFLLLLLLLSKLLVVIWEASGGCHAHVISASLQHEHVLLLLLLVLLLSLVPWPGRCFGTLLWLRSTRFALRNAVVGVAGLCDIARSGV